MNGEEGDEFDPLNDRLVEDITAIENRKIEEAVFLHSFIPTSLSDLGSDAHQELKRLQSGQREPAFAEAIMNMIHVVKKSDPASSSRVTGGSSVLFSLKDGEVGAGRSVSSESDDDNDDASVDDVDSEDSDVDAEDNNREKYRRCLPSRDDETARLAEKSARKQARKEAKEAAAVRRQSKLPKHLKKKAMKNSKGK